MPRFRVWVEETRAGNFQVRSRDKNGKKRSHYCIEKYETAILTGPDGKDKKFTGKTLASRYADLILGQHHRDELGDVDLSQGIQPLQEKYDEDQESNNLAIATRSHRRISLQAFLKETNHKILSDITDENIRAWKVRMVKDGYANETIRGRLGDLRAFLSWLVLTKRLKTSPFGGKIIPREKKNEPRFYTTAEFMALDTALEGINGDAKRACNMAHGGGFRKVELVGDGVSDRDRLCYEDITYFGDGSINVHLRPEVVKGQKHARDVLIVDPQLIEMIGRGRGPVITITRNQLDHFFNRARKLAGINLELDIHGLRHTFAKNYLQAGGSMKALMDIMGHVDPKTTLIYSQFEKSYLKESMMNVYKRHLAERKLAGQNVIPPSLAGQMQGKKSEVNAKNGRRMPVDANITILNGNGYVAKK